MGRGQKVFLIGLVLLAALIGILVWRNRQPPMLPENENHAGITSGERCLVCHGPEDELTRGRNHPLGFDCARCHGTR